MKEYKIDFIEYECMLKKCREEKMLGDSYGFTNKEGKIFDIIVHNSNEKILRKIEKKESVEYFLVDSENIEKSFG